MITKARCECCGRRSKNTKYCRDCKQWLPVDKFYKVKKQIFKKYCIDCLDANHTIIIPPNNKPLVVLFDGDVYKKDLTNLFDGSE